MGNKLVEGLAAVADSSREIRPCIEILDFRVVKAFMIGRPDGADGGWVLVDTGLENSAEFIRKTAEKRFGKDLSPKAIILTHGHFDHVGSVKTLAEHWEVPVYAHPLEMPYITGEKDYPLADPSVGGGMVAGMSRTFPHTRIDIGFRATELPRDESVPGLAHWKWIHTPGHTDGHICLYREKDRVLLAGDSLTTVKQESLTAVITQKEEIGGPPAYLTTDWEEAERSVRRLKELEPALVIPSHGQPLEGDSLTRHLELLVAKFDEIAVPDQGRFVEGEGRE